MREKSKGLYWVLAITIGLLMFTLILYFNNTKTVLGGGYGKTSSACNTTTSYVAEVGGSTSNGSAVILAAKSGRAWARIQGIATSSVVTYLSFDEGANALTGSGMAIAGGVTTTSTPKFVDFGLNADFSYTGAVTGIVDGAATSSVLVTECQY